MPATKPSPYAACAAPRPQLIVSDGADWTQNVPDVEFPHIRRIYEMMGAGGQVENVHLPDEAHDYGLSKAAATIRFWGSPLTACWTLRESPTPTRSRSSRRRSCMFYFGEPASGGDPLRRRSHQALLEESRK